MALKMRGTCERCAGPLDQAAEAYVCVFECTFCATCTLIMDARCPHDGYELARRPRARIRGKIADSMQAPFAFPDVQAMMLADLCIIRSSAPLAALASTVAGGGHSQTRVILNATVPRDYDGANPAQDLRLRALREGIDEPFIGMMTGVPMAQARTVVLRDQGLTVGAIVTAGISNPAAAGITAPAARRLGTINMIVLVDAALSAGALVNAALTATEAKVAVLHERGVRTADGYPATGTATDALVIACAERGDPLPYAGPATAVGYLIARSVRESLGLAIACVAPIEEHG